MRAILEKYGLALFVLVVIGIMIGMGPIIGNTFSNQLQNEVITYTDHEGEMIVGTTFNSMIPNEATSVVFTWRKAPDGAALTDVSVMGDGSVVAWMDGTTFMVSTQKFEKPILANRDCSRMFQNKTNLVSIDFENLDTSNVIYMSCMFYECINLISIDVSSFNMSKVEHISDMFGYCQKLVTLDVSNWDTKNITRMWGVFENCCNLETLNVSNWDTSNVNTMRNMFCECRNLSANCSSWNVTKVTDHYAFRYNAPNVTQPIWP